MKRPETGEDRFIQTSWNLRNSNGMRKNGGEKKKRPVSRSNRTNVLKQDIPMTCSQNNVETSYLF